jgi:anti-sigma factor RsiW
MDKAAEGRSDNSAGNKKSDKNPHLSDEQLLFALDGELTADESADIKVHLEACWSCRARSEQIEEAIASVVEYRDLLTTSFAPTSTGGRAMFVARLQQLARSVGKPTLRNRLVGKLRALQVFLQGALPRHAGISGLVMATIILLLFTRPWEVRKVSASQLLENAQVSEVRALRTVARPVVYQKLSIRIGNEALTRTIYRDPDGMRQTDRVDVPGPSEELSGSVAFPGQPAKRSVSMQIAKHEIEQTFVQAHLNWQDPLSPATYKDWHNNLNEKQDQVSLTGNNLLTLTTTTNEGPIAEARLTFRTSDFHPIAAILRLHDTRQVEVTELVWDVFPMEAVDPTIFSTEPMRTPDVPHSANLVPPPPPPSDAELAESELQARVAIHAEGADLGEQIELDRDPAVSKPASVVRSVVVRGIVSTPERKDRLLAALQGIAHVELRLQTVEEAATQQKEVTTEKSEAIEPQIEQGTPLPENRVATASVVVRPNEPSAVAVIGRRALEEQLQERYPKAEDRAAFTNKTVELVQEALAQAWALRRLRDRYGPETVARLSRGSRQTLELLIRDHVSALRQHVDEARDMVATLVPPELSTEVSPRPILDSPMSPSETVSDWRYTVTEIFPEVQRMNENIAAMLAETGRSAAEGQALVHDLQLALAKLQAELPVLYQHVSGPFLSEQ